MFNIKPIRTVPEQIAEMIKDAIISGQLSQGERLPSENDLASQFGVSRTIIREALELLESEQIINVIRGKQSGRFVSKWTDEDVIKYMEHYIALSARVNLLSLDKLNEIRSPIEIKGCSLAALRRTEKELQEIRGGLPSKVQVLTAYQFEQMDIQFHRNIAQATHNHLMLVMMNSFTKAYEVLTRQVGINSIFYQEEIINNIYKVYQAVADKDAQEAGKAMAEHLEFFNNMTKDTDQTSLKNSGILP
jgi:GntR family transcriptional regulator, transcriptional repressor for pyruvate dehydrogenase complex